MDEFYNKHYVTVDEQGRVIDGWSDGPRPDKDISGAICINEQGGYQFRLTPGGEENPRLYTGDGIPRHKLVEGEVVKRTVEEIEADRSDIPAPGPSAAERLEAQVVYTAMMTDTLLEV